MAVICALQLAANFSKPHLNPELVIKTRKISSGIDSHTLNAFVLKSKISNDGRRSSQNTRINIKIDGLTDGLESHPWIVIGTDGGL